MFWGVYYSQQQQAARGKEKRERENRKKKRRKNRKGEETVPQHQLAGKHCLSWQGFSFSPLTFSSHNIPVVAQYSAVSLTVLNETSFFQLVKEKDHLKPLGKK